MSLASIPQNSRLGRTLSVLRDVMSRPSGAVGLCLVVFHLILAVISPYIAPFDYRTMNAAMMLTGPDGVHFLGTDHLGRDVFSRTIQGGREAILVTGIATPIAVAWGGLVGIFFGLIGGRVDEVMMRFVDAFLSLPWILKMLVLIVTFGTGIEVLIPTLAFFYGIPVIRIARAATHDVVARDFVLAARARGRAAQVPFGALDHRLRLLASTERDILKGNANPRLFLERLFVHLVDDARAGRAGGPGCARRLLQTLDQGRRWRIACISPRRN